MESRSHIHPWMNFKEMISAIKDFVSDGIWDIDEASLSPLQAFALHKVKVFIFLVRQFYSDNLLIRASSLTYSTLLAIVPFLAVVFSIFKLVGLHMNLAPTLRNILSPLGHRGIQISTKIVEFVENAQTEALGVAGFVILLITAFGILNKIEGLYNDIWHVPRQRTWSRKVADYTVLTVIGPLMLFLILTATASFTSITYIQDLLSHRVFATIEVIGLKLFPYVLSCLLFTLIIRFVPNVHVKMKPALAGGLLSGVLWELSNWGFARFVVGATRVTAREVLFAGFAALPLFLLWLYVGWSIVLLGAELGYVVQHVRAMEWRVLERRYGETIRRFAGIRAVLEIVRAFEKGKGGAKLDELAREVAAPEPVIRKLLEPLITANILTYTCDDERYLPAREPASITIIDVLLALQGGAALPERLRPDDPLGQSVERLLRQADASLRAGTANISLLEAIRWRQEARE